MLALNLVLNSLALLGHAALWVGLANRIHATGAPRWLVKTLSGISHALLGALPVVALWWWWNAGKSVEEGLNWAGENRLVWIYLVPCWALGTITAVLWVRRELFVKTILAIGANHTVVVDVAAKLNRQPLAGFRARLLSHVPGNQVLQLAISEKQLQLERLPSELDGFSIAHLSDLHFTGRIGIEFFQEVMRQTAALRADLIVLTGDIVDEVEYLDWVPSTLATLTAPLGVYFVLGNHDQFTGEAARVRHALTQAGLVDLGGRWKHLDVSGVDVIVAGNELPWFAPAADMEHCPPRTAEHAQLRILLSHSPDQFDWARRWDFDLVLAGHTHGGQIRLPLVGPVVCPSWHGVKYAAGTFYATPTVLHVSRGISSELPMRLNCRPELAKLVLRTAKAG